MERKAKEDCGQAAAEWRAVVWLRWSNDVENKATNICMHYLLVLSGCFGMLLHSVCTTCSM